MAEEKEKEKIDRNKEYREAFKKLNERTKKSWKEELTDENLLKKLNLSSRLPQAMPNLMQQSSLIKVNFNQQFLNPYSSESSLINVNIDGAKAAELLKGNPIDNVFEMGQDMIGGLKEQIINGMKVPLNPETPNMIKDLCIWMAKDLATTVGEYLMSRFEKYISPEYPIMLLGDATKYALDVTQKNIKSPDEILKELKEDAKESIENKSKEKEEKDKKSLTTNFGGYLAIAKDEINKAVGEIPPEVIDALGKYIYLGPEYFIKQVQKIYEDLLYKGICTADQYILLAESIGRSFVFDQANIVGLKTAEYLNEAQKFMLDKGIKLTMTQQSALMISAKSMINKGVMQLMGLIGG
jgi:hypothetical protein